MDASLVEALASYFTMHFVVYFIETENFQLLKTNSTELQFQTSWYTEYSRDLLIEEKSLIVCEIALACKDLFEATVPPKRSTLAFLFNSLSHSGKEFADLRYDDNIIKVHGGGVIYELYGFKGNTFQQEFGLWDSGSTTLTSPKLSKWERRANMRGARIRTAILHWHPVTINLTHSDSTQPSWKGYMIDVLESLQSRLNFTLEFTSPEDGLWGTKVKKVMGYSTNFNVKLCNIPSKYWCTSTCL